MPYHASMDGLADLLASLGTGGILRADAEGLLLVVRDDDGERVERADPRGEYYGGELPA